VSSKISVPKASSVRSPAAISWAIAEVRKADQPVSGGEVLGHVHLEEVPREVVHGRGVDLRSRRSHAVSGVKVRQDTSIEG
jgi:hypothetical protein